MILYYLTIFLKKRPGKIPLFPLLFCINLFFITLIFYGFYRLTLPFMVFFLMPAIHYPFYLSELLLKNFLKDGKAKSQRR